MPGFSNQDGAVKRLKSAILRIRAFLADFSPAGPSVSVSGERRHEFVNWARSGGSASAFEVIGIETKEPSSCITKFNEVTPAMDTE